MNKYFFIQLIILLFFALSGITISQELRNIVPPRSKYLYELKNIRLAKMRDSLNSGIYETEFDRQNIEQTVTEIYFKTLRYNIYKYSLYDRFDTLKTLNYIIREIGSSPYFNSKVDKWDGPMILSYITFRIEYNILIKYFSEFDLDDFKRTEVYSNLIKRARKEQIRAGSVDSVLKKITQIGFNPLHFYYKPRSVEQQLRSDKFDITKFNFEKLKDFSDQYAGVLQKAQDRYNVNKEIIVAILRKETDLGRVKLSYNPYQVLIAQSLFSIENPAETVKERTKNIKRIEKLKRSAENSLYNMIRYTISNSLEPSGLESNLVGALGFTQFMPFNLHLAADGDGDGIADLSNMDDAIMSIGNFLHHNGWKRFYKLDRSNKNTIEKLILKYNTSSTYAESVFLIALELKNRMKK
ncbi:MAG: lytic murein transglycosylase [Candidatus Delongbacteria bacterium]